MSEMVILCNWKMVVENQAFLKKLRVLNQISSNIRPLNLHLKVTDINKIFFLFEFFFNSD